MASTAPLATILLALLPSLFLIAPGAVAQKAPAPAPAGPINLTAILDKGGQYTTFIRLLGSTQVINQIENQLNSSTQGLTVFAPTDNAFSNLKAGTLNGLSAQDQSELILYHVLPQYQSMVSFQTISNPVRTQAGSEGGSLGLNFTSSGNQVNVSTGLVNTQVNNALRQDPPLAVYQIDKVLLPPELFGVKSKASAPQPSKTPSDASSNKTSPATVASSAKGPSSADESSGSNGLTVGLGLDI
uniref:FAS1 domain-containing protein n=1 Tax=Nelumbo nucifera TaxID=4432 RepID=A0A822XQS0_NELNU|nr:TPA_asm: hypothetical protein HUJ06_022548 [Nelumbo nucifera]